MRKDRYDWLLGYLSTGKLSVDVERGLLLGRSSYLTSDGYMRISLCHRNVKKMYYVHELIAVAGGLNPTGLSINHIDGNKFNNRLDNLECITIGDNQKHKAETGLSARGSRNGKAKINEDTARQIKKMLSGGWTGIAIADKFNISKYLVSDIKRGKTWTHI